MSRTIHDQFIDDDEEEEVCPLCVEELDLTDKNFRPCPCGYQICQFCYNNIKTTMNGLCPACRRPYDDKNIQYKVVSQEEMAQHKINLAQQAKKRAAARQKEAQKREADHLSRKHLAGLRVRQKNLVYVTGLKPKHTGDKLVEGLRDKEFFGQYGDILKIVVSKSKDAHIQLNQPVGIYITFVRKDDAASCIASIDGFRYPDGTRLRAQYGTTKYCSAYLRGDTCTNRNCMFLHEPGEDSESFTRQDLSNLNAISTQQPALGGVPVSQSPQPQAPPQHTQPVAAASLDNENAIVSPSDSPHPGPALPATASWADQARRASRATTTSASSPLVTNATLAPTLEPKVVEKPEKAAEKAPARAAQEPKSSTPAPEKSTSGTGSKPRKPKYPYLDELPRKAFGPSVVFNFAFPESFTDKDRWIVENMPPLFDPHEGTRRRLIKEREAEELERQVEAQIAAKPPSAVEGAEEHQEQAPGGSSQLGGEPEERPDRAFSQHNMLQQVIGSSNFGLGQTAGFNDELSGLGGTRSAGQQTQQQQLLLQQLNKLGNSANSSGNHTRHPSRYFLNEAIGTASKNFAKAGGMLGQNQLGNALGQTQNLGNQFSYSNVQGPPPGLKTTGTPPAIGGNMFGQGHNFALGAGYNNTRENDKLWDMQRGRAAGSQAAGKHFLPDLGQTGGDDDDFPALPRMLSPLVSSRRSTPAIPPGLAPPPGLPIQRPQQQNNKSTEVPEPSAILSLTPKKPAAPILRPASSAAAKERLEDDGSPALKAKVRPATPLRQVSTPTIVSRVHSRNVSKTTASPARSRAQSLLKEEVKGEHKPTKEEKAIPKPQVVEEKNLAPKSMAAQLVLSTEPPKDDTAVQYAISKGKQPANLGDGSPVKSTMKRRAPGTLKITTTTSQEKETTLAETSKADVIGISRPPSVSQPAVSRPGTPAAEALSTPIKRIANPRTLRITETLKTEGPPPLSEAAPPMPALPSVLPGSKMSSRRPSITSTYVPGTPSTEQIEFSSQPSASVAASRASSPPPLAGKKRAEKKDKKSKKVKRQESAQVVDHIIEQAKAEEHQPIIGRKKKAKKPGSGPLPSAVKVPSISSAAVSVPASPGVKPPEAKIEVATPVDDGIRVEAAPELTEPAEPVAPMVKTLDSLISLLGPELERVINGILVKPVSMSAHLRNVEGTTPSSRPFSHPADLNAYLAAQDPVVFSPADHAARAAGKPIRKSDQDDRLASRLIETIRGTRLRCLTPAEEDQLVELEERVCAINGSGFWGGGHEYLIPGMQGYEEVQRRKAMDSLNELFPPGCVTLEDASGNAWPSSEPSALINQFVFAMEDGDNIAPPPGTPAEPSPSKQTAAPSMPPPPPHTPTSAQEPPIPARTARDAAEFLKSFAADGSAALYDAPPSSSALDRSASSSSSITISAEAAAQAAARAAAAINDTRGCIAEAIGPGSAYALSGGHVGSVSSASVKQAQLVWTEEKRKAELIEKKLNGVIKKNRKVLSSAGKMLPKRK